MKLKTILPAFCLMQSCLTAQDIVSTEKPNLDKGSSRPNILLAISDDQSWPHASAYGCKFVNTPAFDRMACEGVLFHNAFSPAPQCSPCRAAILTGMNPWQNGDAAVHGSPIPAHIPLYPALLEKAGYHVGATGKGWAPGVIAKGKHNPAGKHYNFNNFLEKRKPNQPFCFWFGAREPHRNYKKGSGLKAGKKLSSVTVPSFLPDHESVRSDFLDYALQIEKFDTKLEVMLKKLEAIGELENTIVVVTSDNGMPWSRAKANLYEYGVHMPMAIRWGSQVTGKRSVTDLVSLIDLAPTFLDAAGVAIPKGMSGRSLLNILKSKKSGLIEPDYDAIYVGSERHTPYVRENDRGYPCRAIRTHEYLYIWNMKPNRWPEGDTYYSGGSSSTRDLYIKECDNPEIQRYIRFTWGKRPEEELFKITTDVDCMFNLAGKAEYAEIQKKLRGKLRATLRKQKDPRVFGNDYYDDLEYFRDIWPGLRVKHLKQVAPVHRAMEKAGWQVSAKDKK